MTQDALSDGSNLNATVVELKEYTFTPMATIIGFVFIATTFSFLAIIKLFFASSDHYMTNNRFDLVIFKPPKNKSTHGPRRIYGNKKVNTHNIRAAAACGFDHKDIRNNGSYNSF